MPNARIPDLLDNGRAADAVPWLRNAVVVNPSDPTAQESLAIALMKAGEANAGEAIPHFTEAVRLQPASYPTRINFGTALCRVGRIDECLVQFQEAERLDPKSIDAPLMAARAHAAAGRFDAALASLEKAHAIATATGQTDRARELAVMIQRTQSGDRAVANTRRRHRARQCVSSQVYVFRSASLG